MKLVTFENSVRQSRIGAWTGDDRIVDLNSAYGLYLRDVRREGSPARLADALVPANMRALFEGGDTSLEAARDALDHALHQPNRATGAHGEPVFYAVADITLKAPIVPKKFFHTAGNFREHHEEATKAGFSHPVMPWIVFFQNVDAIIGPDEPVIFPPHLTQELDYELELAVVLKKAGKHFGPETANEYKDPHNLAMELRVNGESRQVSHSSKMSVTIPEILAHYSAMGYSAGDVVSTGTVSGVAAFSADPKAWFLKPGDVMECEIEQIGVLRNPVISWEEAYGEKLPSLTAEKQ